MFNLPRSRSCVLCSLLLCQIFLLCLSRVTLDPPPAPLLPVPQHPHPCTPSPAPPPLHSTTPRTQPHRPPPLQSALSLPPSVPLLATPAHPPPPPAGRATPPGPPLPAPLPIALLDIQSRHHCSWVQSTAGSLQSLCWASSAVGGIASAYFSGSLVEAYGPRGVFGLTALFPLIVSLSAVFISEQPVVKSDRHKRDRLSEDNADAAESGTNA